MSVPSLGAASALTHPGVQGKSGKSSPPQRAKKRSEARCWPPFRICMRSVGELSGLSTAVNWFSLALVKLTLASGKVAVCEARFATG